MKGTNKLVMIVKAVFYIAVVFLSALFLYQFLFKELPPNVIGEPNWEVFEITPQVGDPSVGLILGYVLFAISILLIVFFFIRQLIDNPKKTIGSLFGFIAIIIVFLLVWVISKDNTTYDKVSETVSRIVGASLGLLYIMGGIAVLTILVTEVWSYFK